jgi:hypothetical protein
MEMIKHGGAIKKSHRLKNATYVARFSEDLDTSRTAINGQAASGSYERTD